MDEFERLLKQHIGPLERFIKFRLNDTGDAEDLLQEVCLTAYEKYHTLREPEKLPLPVTTTLAVPALTLFL